MEVLHVLRGTTVLYLLIVGLLPETITGHHHKQIQENQKGKQYQTQLWLHLWQMVGSGGLDHLVQKATRSMFPHLVLILRWTVLMLKIRQMMI